ncbi:EAL and modified HD-GYP domain-containing signal transduction protein [Modicisalibacter muralis]|uniref:EAL and modified HD-GYP domain-containing signal transduction protein n=1 Tax=Modicisalibacter muralis TaxID=119000 RepID=A0A1G9JZQ7_9GAMM|nr:HDOD domain-containing protein [Halomonas muralis]SDL42654.1 EAL and modified HD-GYP domain-containing signal transduction protein [Halomonas muralis]
MASSESTRTTVLFARQPIYDRQRGLVGCELLFRPCPDTNACSMPFDGDIATLQVMISAFTETNIREVCEHTPAYINFTASTLKTELPFSPNDMVVEILETVEADAEVIAAIRRCQAQGYRIALDDYRLKDIDHPLLPFADIVKLDYPHFDTIELTRLVVALRQASPRLLILAEKIETHEDFLCCLEAGCDLFQGYFLARPAPVQGQHMPQSRLSVMQLLAKLNHPDVSIRELTDIVQRDPFMSVRLMKMADSAYYRRAHDITSVQMAVTLIGQRRIRNLASMLALTKLDDKPHALQKLALIRGYLCEELAEHLPDRPTSGFTVGLFSCLDAFFDLPLDTILDDIPLHDSIKQAILAHSGSIGLILSTVLHLERCELDTLDWPALGALGITPERLSHAQQHAIEITNTQW